MDISSYSASSNKDNEVAFTVDLTSERKRLEEKLRKEKIERSNIFKRELANCTKKKKIIAFFASFFPIILVLIVGLLTGVTKDGFGETLGFFVVCSLIILAIVCEIINVVMSIKTKKRLGFNKNGELVTKTN